MTIGQRIRFLRMLSGMTQEELGIEFDQLSRDEVSRLELDQSEPFDGLHDNLAALFNTRPLWTRRGLPPAFDKIGYFSFYPMSIFIGDSSLLSLKMETLSDSFARYFPMFVAENKISEYSVASDPESTRDDEPQIDKVYVFYISQMAGGRDSRLILSAFDQSYDIIERGIALTSLKKVKEVNVDYDIFLDLRRKDGKHCWALLQILDAVDGLDHIITNTYSG